MVNKKKAPQKQRADKLHIEGAKLSIALEVDIVNSIDGQSMLRLVDKLPVLPGQNPLTDRRARTIVQIAFDNAVTATRFKVGQKVMLTIE